MKMSPADLQKQHTVLLTIITCTQHDRAECDWIWQNICVESGDVRTSSGPDLVTGGGEDLSDHLLFKINLFISVPGHGPSPTCSARPAVSPAVVLL